MLDETPGGDTAALRHSIVCEHREWAIQASRYRGRRNVHRRFRTSRSKSNDDLPPGPRPRCPPSKSELPTGIVSCSHLPPNCFPTFWLRATLGRLPSASQHRSVRMANDEIQPEANPLRSQLPNQVYPRPSAGYLRVSSVADRCARMQGKSALD